MIWWRPPIQQAVRKWYETEIARHLCFRGMATMICAKALFTPAFSEVPANDRDGIRW
jgi:hypothetical protein